MTTLYRQHICVKINIQGSVFGKFTLAYDNCRQGAYSDCK